MTDICLLCVCTSLVYVLLCVIRSGADWEDEG